MTSYVDPDGYDWEVAEDYIQGHVLGFCLCGHPEYSLSLTRDVLRHISNLKEFVWSKQQTYEEWAA